MPTRIPSISVIIPVYNAESFLAEAVQSVQEQTFKASEIIIVDDGSTDQSLKLARSLEPHVTVYSQANQGAAAARNFGVNVSQGNLLAFLDADDLWELDKLEKQLKVLYEFPELDMVFGHMQQFYENRTVTNTENKILAGLSHETLLIWKDNYMRVGQLETKWKVGEFLDWYARAKDLGLKDMLLPDLVAKRRIHDNNFGIREKNASHDYLKVIKASLDRRRLAIT